MKILKTNRKNHKFSPSKIGSRHTGHEFPAAGIDRGLWDLLLFKVGGKNDSKKRKKLWEKKIYTIPFEVAVGVEGLLWPNENRPKI